MTFEEQSFAFSAGARLGSMDADFFLHLRVFAQIDKLCPQTPLQMRESSLTSFG